MISQLLLIGLATLVSEDLTCIAAGVLIAQGKLGFIQGTAACVTGIFCGDALLFVAGRLLGPRVLRWRLITRFLSPAMVERGVTWLQRKGLVVVFLSRLTPGLRLPTYFAAGLLPTKARAFLTYFFIAAVIWTPLIVGATAVFGDGLLRAIFSRRGETLAAFATVFGAAVMLTRLISTLRSYHGRRRLVGFLKRKVRWEFWPPWAVYLPLVPYLLYLACRHRSLTLFTAANPGIRSGGFVGESKSEILSHLSRVSGIVPEYTVVPANLDARRRVQVARRFLREHGLCYPVVLKPDVGERGNGVAVIRSAGELSGYLQRATTDVIMQRYVDGEEFGVFYYRHPKESRGHILSITEKRLPVVMGDGKRSLRELILGDSRAVCLAAAYEQASKRPLDDVPQTGEVVQLTEVGSHCRGAIFLDASHLRTAALEDAIDRISRSHPGFYLGRYDIRTQSAETLREGGPLSVIELNGVSAEATHIYDPAVSLWEAYRVMGRQWRIAFVIGAANRSQGKQPMGAVALVRLLAALVLTRRKTAASIGDPVVHEGGSYESRVSASVLALRLSRATTSRPGVDRIDDKLLVEVKSCCQDLFLVPTARYRILG